MASASADQNLLFGILALQMDFVTREQLISAMNAWVLQKNTPLAELLRQQGTLGADEHELLCALVQKHLRRHGDDAARSLAAVTALGSTPEELRLIADDDLQASLANVTTGPGAEDPYATRITSVGSDTSSGQRFRILRPHAKGGLGQVSVALDVELQREVALKEIQDQHADDLNSRSRFMLEAEITGGLEHPGIVPVYGLGTYGDGRPYYAMRFIRGDSLRDALERFHQEDGARRDPGERAVEFRKLIGRFVDVCDAIAYAHSRGVLHRDLKPGNIMLGKYGETLVVDWGLAKPLDGMEATVHLGEKPLRPAALSGTAETLAGSALGTPQFMSPEQSAGRLDLLGPASDVYSLGATLYQLLTGQPPFADADLGRVLQKVQQGDFEPPRQRKRDVPPALEAICLKAMACRPEDRYASPRELAEDIEHWLADERVSAYAEPWTSRLGRWSRQHRVMVGSAAAAAAILTTIVIAGILLASSADRERLERHRADEQARLTRQMDGLRSQAEEARGRAEEARRVAEGARRDLAQLNYIRQMDLAHREWQEGNIVRVLALLEETNPALRRWEWGHVNRLCHDYLANWKANISRLDKKTVALTPDRKLLAAPGDDNRVNVWDPQTGELIGSFPVHTTAIQSIAISPDGTRIASSAEGNGFAVKVWNARTGQVELTLQGHTNNVITACFRACLAIADVDTIEWTNSHSTPARP
jgi:serine/threonine protein kinase